MESSDSVAMDEEQSLPLPGEESKKEESESVPAVSTLLPKTEPNSFLGKHRMAAAISQLQYQITYIQEELNELETFGESSIVCKELVSSVESIPDPLLPSTKGPANVIWDRWFRATHDSRKRWI